MFQVCGQKQRSSHTRHAQLDRCSGATVVLNFNASICVCLPAIKLNFTLWNLQHPLINLREFGPFARVSVEQGVVYVLSKVSHRIHKAWYRYLLLCVPTSQCTQAQRAGRWTLLYSYLNVPFTGSTEQLLSASVSQG